MSRQFTWWRRFWGVRKMPKQMLYKAVSELQQRIEFGEYEVDNLGREYMLEELIFEQKEKALKKCVSYQMKQTRNPSSYTKCEHHITKLTHC